MHHARAPGRRGGSEECTLGRLGWDGGRVCSYRPPRRVAVPRVPSQTAGDQLRGGLAGGDLVRSGAPLLQAAALRRGSGHDGCTAHAREHDPHQRDPRRRGCCRAVPPGDAPHPPGSASPTAIRDLPTAPGRGPGCSAAPGA
eukprot:11868170-Heterocapsa_arctica.AAC.1